MPWEQLKCVTMVADGVLFGANLPIASIVNHNLPIWEAYNACVQIHRSCKRNAALQIRATVLVHREIGLAPIRKWRHGLRS